jgi:arylsulfatase A-like enzyme
MSGNRTGAELRTRRHARKTAPAQASGTRARNERRPNILLFITDQQRADYLGCYGHPVLQTPNIDAIARKGARFERCYVTAPVCMPNRASLMTGRMPSVHGVRMNGIPLSFQQATFVEVLRNSGYRTALIGKSHLQNMVDLPPAVQTKRKHNSRCRSNAVPGEAVRRAVGDYEQELPSRWSGTDPLKLHLPYYGFEHVDLCTGHGDLVGGHYYQWLREMMPNPERLRGEACQLAHRYRCPQAWRTRLPEELYPTRYIEQRALDYLDQHTSVDDPFFLMVSFPDPHHPFTPPGRYWEMYRPEDMRLDASFRERKRALPQVKWARAERKNNHKAGDGYGAIAVTEREAREAMALTCGMIAMIDDAVGRIMARLFENNLQSNTVIIFTSDHGDLLGDHGMLFKGPVHFQSLIRVPLIWMDPKRTQAVPVSSMLCSTIDISASILDRIRIDPYNGLQGRSILPALNGGTVRDWVLIEEDAQEAQFGINEGSRLRTLITDEYRLTICGSSQGELFDLKADPHELANEWGRPETKTIQAQLMEILARAQMDVADRSPMPVYLA